MQHSKSSYDLWVISFQIFTWNIYKYHPVTWKWFLIMCINDVTVQICQLHNIAVTLASCMFTRIVKYSIAKSLSLQQIWNDFVDTHSITSKVENSIKIMFMIWMRSFTLLLPWILKWYFLPLISYISLSLSLSIILSLDVIFAGSILVRWVKDLWFWTNT